MLQLRDAITVAAPVLPDFNAQSKLVKLIMVALMYDMQKKCILLKDKNSISWQPETAIAFYISFTALQPSRQTTVQLPVVVKDNSASFFSEPFTAVLFGSILTEIHKKFIV